MAKKRKQKMLLGLGAAQTCAVRAGTRVEFENPTKYGTIELSPSQCARFPPGKHLGEGVFATAYVHANDPYRVVKFTGDAREANVAARLLGVQLKGSVTVFDVARLRGHKAAALVPSKKFSVFTSKEAQPIFGLVTERVKDPSDVTKRAARAIWSQLKPKRTSIVTTDPARFRVADWVDLDKAGDNCEQYALTKEKDQCRIKVEQMAAAIDEQAKNGVIPLDLHAENWGERHNGDPVILDFGVAAAPGPKPKIELAKAPKARCAKGRKGKACRGRIRRK